MSETAGHTAVPYGWSEGGVARTLFLIGVAFSAFQIITASLSPLSSQIVRALHVGFLLLMTFGIAAAVRPRLDAQGVVLWLIGIIAFGMAFYHWVYEGDLILRAGDPTDMDLIIGAITVVMVFEAARRVIGLALPLICLSFLAYALFGQYLPGDWAHRGYAWSQVIDQLGFGTEGIYGIPTYVSSSYIFLFILFGTFLEQAGMIRLFTDFALGTVGHTHGGPAKVSVVSSGLMGTISGSGVANVVTTGQFTIPLMKRFGYSSEFAGGVEATSSMGGQIMPPVMGAVAFIMAETIGVPYVDICIAAAIPAALYFFTAFLMVHLEAGRKGLVGLPKSECPNALDALKRDWHLLLPLAVLVYLLFSGFTPLFSGTVGLALTAILIFGGAVALRVRGTALRVAFWVALALASSAFIKVGIGIFFAIIAVLVVGCFLVQGGRETLRVAVNALAEGARHALPVGVACALVGVIIGCLTLTGAATMFANTIIDLGRDSLILSLVLTMLVCLLLGMGIPTIPNYIITSSLAAPALLELGVPLVVSHMFVFYFGIMADLTPPVALAAFAAAPIARTSGMKIGMQALRIAIAGFVVPYMAVYSPALMLQGDWTVLSVLYIVGKAVAAIILWGAASIGYLGAPLGWPIRVIAGVGAVLLVTAQPLTDELGLAVAAGVMAFAWWRRRTVVAA
ncbi:TRAP transporter permease [Denitromonas halophila]|nr:TRAP transporter permease [Denitromonas halophila]